MGMPANAVTAKDATPTRSPDVTMLRKHAPQIRSAVAIIEKHEQIQDGLERGALTGKIAEQMNQTLKGITGIAKLELQYLALLLKFGRKVPVPRSPVLRSVVGLGAEMSAKDGEYVRALIGAAEK